MVTFGTCVALEVQFASMDGVPSNHPSAIIYVSWVFLADQINSHTRDTFCYLCRSSVVIHYPLQISAAAPKIIVPWAFPMD